MKTIITEEMRFRQRVVKYAIKHDNNAKAARRYHTSRQQVQRWRKRYDGDVRSLANKSRRPQFHPNQHTQEELDLIKHKHRYHQHEGYAQVYRKLRDAGYKRTYDSMCRQLRKMKLNVAKKRASYPKSNYRKDATTYPGERVQIDVKYVPNECIGFASNHSRYYQITAIDEYSRKRYLELVNELSTYSTSNFLTRLEDKLGFKVELVQTDNGIEFVNDQDITNKKTRFEKYLEKLDIKHKRIRPYSPWQNGIVERSHRIDNELFYSRRRFSSYKEMEKSFRRYSNKYNNIARKILNFKTPNEIVEEYFSKNAA
ncbi:DDE-type integrase/transposase/recombinase [Tissierella pigra]|nr:DDE-type integrase/transposase/recombinase [Tissierella pigra]MBU5425215.1 DDE-type integrase/transposase/recombinase [Tissierella pigra]MBU5425935.1 DDE-type integrase/transposase/recombinase [Tissierella pigra]MBU5426009.1 DDE-type integrase/transposase/recombinase [Tissierella pigra]MBU5426205.1 DDE-type integrase/transposase/recombinase [Tissierella pigra]MBU5427033.1 DDE-type integrase/transposase/recombinase [Tissierella pigra]